MRTLFAFAVACMAVCAPALVRAAASGDVEALSAVMAVDSNEIAAAETALAKGVQGDVRQYAEMMKSQHGKNMSKAAALAEKLNILPADTDTVRQLRADGDRDMAALSPLEGEQFAGAYIDAMVRGHAKVLDMIDVHLLPGAQEDAVRGHLKQTRKSVSMHLDKAKKLQAQHS